MFRLHQLLDRYADAVRVQQAWRDSDRADMVTDTQASIDRIRDEIERDVLHALRRAVA